VEIPYSLAAYFLNVQKMRQDILNEIHKVSLKKLPEIKTGYTVKVHQKIKEGSKERVQMFEGLVIKISSGAGTDKSFTVRRIASGVGVEKIFPFHSPNIAKIDVIKKAKVRRSKLYYMRNKTGKAARLQEEYMGGRDDDIIEAKEEPKKEEEKKEAVKAEQK
jgi:large subunit ribosomal protein L19